MICPHCGNDTKKWNTSEVTVDRDEQGRTKTWTDIISDQNGKLVSKRVDEYSYYPTGEVHIIFMNVFSGSSLVSTTSLEHFRNGAQPIVTIITHQAP